MNEVFAVLSNNGAIPVDHSFLWNGGVVTWVPGQRTLMSIRIHNGRLFDKCSEYLRSVGAEFVTVQQLKDWAVLHAWPQVEEILSMSEGDMQ